MSGAWVSWLDNQLQNGGWVAWILDKTEAHKLTAFTFCCFVLAVAIASHHPAESQRRGLWIMIMDSPWTLRGIIDGKLHALNALKQQVWLVFGSASDLWSVFHDDDEYFDSDGKKFKFLQIKRFSLPFAIGYTDRNEDSARKAKRPVQLTADGVRYISVERGRIARLFETDAAKASYHIQAKLLTTCLAPNPTEIRLEEMTDQRAENRSNVGERATAEAADPPARSQESTSLSRRKPLLFQWVVSSYPLSLPAMLSSWGDSLFAATVIFGLWLTVATFHLGYGCLAMGGTTMAVGYFSKRVMQVFQASQEDLDVLSILGEVGKLLMSDERLSMVGGGVLVLEVKRCIESANFNPSEPNQTANAPTLPNQPDTSEDAGTAAAPLTRNLDPIGDQGQLHLVPPTNVEWIKREIQVQWRKPLRPPHLPWFGVCCGPLISRTLGWGQVYSLVMIASGTVSPPMMKSTGFFSGFALASVSLMGALLSMSGGNTRQPVLLRTSCGMMAVGVFTRMVVSTTRAFNQFFSYAYFEQFSGTLIAVGAWMLAAAMNPPDLVQSQNTTASMFNSSSPTPTPNITLA
jgi:hypothetical protein